MNAPIKTTCPYCGVGCGIVVSNRTEIAGDPAHPSNYGRLCSKGSALGETLGLSERLLHPKIGGRAASWDAALDHVAHGLRTTIDRHGPDAVAFYVSGQLLTEDYYVANKLAKGFLGTANIDTNSRLCMSSSVAGHRRAFGEDLVPCAYEDLDSTDLVVLVGSNAAWCHPILFQRILAAREKRGTRIVVIDPRRSATAMEADLHIAAQAGTDVLLFNGLLAHLDRVGAIAADYVGKHTSGFAEALAAAQADAGDLAAVAARCDLDVADLNRFYEWFAATPRVITAYSQGVNQSSAGTDKVNAIINCHFATGRIGRPGMGPLSLTGQPNAMGGREVGGLANQLAAHMSFDDPVAVDRVRRFWKAPNMATRPGLPAVDMFDALDEERIKAIWIIGTNPAVSMPNAAKIRAALTRCPLVIVSDCSNQTDTGEFADVLLPAAGWGEKDGTVTNSERRISRQRAFAEPAGAARRDWWIISEVGKRLGFAEAFSYGSAADIFREHAALSAFENAGERAFDLGGLATIADAAYDTLEPTQWPVPAGSHEGTPRLFDEARYTTPDRRGRFIAVTQRAPRHEAEPGRPLILNTGRLRDQWHTMTRTGQVPRLGVHMPEPMADIHPQDAAHHGLQAGDLVRLSSRWGSVVARLRPTPDQPRGSVFLPMHWTGQFAADCIIGQAVNPATDPVSYQPELKHTPVAIEKIAVNFEAVLMTRERLKPRGLVHWSRRTADGCDVHMLRGPEQPQDALAQLEEFITPGPAVEMIEYRDFSRAIVRRAWINETGLQYCLFIGPAGSVPDVDALAALFAQEAPLDAAARSALLSGRIAGAADMQGPIICGCHQVGLNTLLEALSRNDVTDVRKLGQLTRAGTNCGSCIPELKQIMAQARRAAAE